MTELCFHHKFLTDLEFRHKFVTDILRVCDRQLLKKFIFIFEINCFIKIKKYILLRRPRLIQQLIGIVRTLINIIESVSKI